MSREQSSAKNPMMASRSWALNASAIAFNVSTETEFCWVMTCLLWIRRDGARPLEHRGWGGARRSCGARVQELTHDTIDELGPGERRHVPSLRDGVKGPVRAGRGEEGHDLPD